MPCESNVRQCQQNVDIENISLPIDPEIAEVCCFLLANSAVFVALEVWTGLDLSVLVEAFEKAKSEGRQLSTDDFKETCDLEIAMASGCFKSNTGPGPA